MSKPGRARDRQAMRKRVKAALDPFPTEYLLDEVVRRVMGPEPGYLWLTYRDGFVVERRRFGYPDSHIIRAVGGTGRTPLLRITPPRRRTITDQ
jgi:hypothetical protein